MWRTGGAAGGSAPPSRSGVARAAGYSLLGPCDASEAYSDDASDAHAEDATGGGGAGPAAAGGGAGRPIVLPSSFMPTLPHKRARVRLGAGDSGGGAATERAERDGVHVVDFSARVMHSAR